VPATDVLELSFREDWGRLLALLVAQFRRLDLAEDGLADAFASAAEHWATEAPPANPSAWLLTAARRKIIDRLRAEAVAVRKEPLLILDAELQAEGQRTVADVGGHVRDERLRLIFLCAHPSLARESAAALSLRLVLGLSTADIARLFLVSEATMAARLTRAKRKLAVAGVPFVMPGGAALADRTGSILAVIYLAFTAGYAPGSGPDATRVQLAGEAIRLARLLRSLLPGAELDALLALMVLQHSRRDARTDAAGDLILLPDQDRSRWHRDEIAEGLALLESVRSASPATPSAYLLQALIAADHATAATAAATRWERIAAHYAELEALTGSPVVRLNRAVAVAEAAGPAAGLRLLDGLDAELPRSHRLPAVRARFLTGLGRLTEARAAYEVALTLCGHEPEARQLRRRLAELELDQRTPHE
jgi:RNA polymerase sigma factor (sigma-70 family)